MSILLLILTTHIHAELQNHEIEITPSIDNKNNFVNMNMTSTSSNNSNSSHTLLELSNSDLSTKTNLSSKKSDVFSIYNFNSIPQKAGINRSKLGDLEYGESNRTYWSDNNMHNNFEKSTILPSIGIDSNQNATNYLNSNRTLFADAGKDQTVNEGTSMTLNGSNSMSKDSIILSYTWKQIPNPTITIGNANTAIWSFVTPMVSTDTTLTFELTVTDNKGMTSTDDVNIIVRDGSMIRNEKNMSNQIIEGTNHDINHTMTAIEPKNLVIQSLVDKNPISKGEKQIIKIDLFDAKSDDKVNNATIKGQIMDSAKKIIKKFSMNNNSVNVSLTIPKNAKMGNSVVSVNASAPGYMSSNMDTYFRIQ
jgi:K319-like protein